MYRQGAFQFIYPKDAEGFAEFLQFAIDNGGEYTEYDPVSEKADVFYFETVPDGLLDYIDTLEGSWNTERAFQAVSVDEESGDAIVEAIPFADVKSRRSEAVSVSGIADKMTSLGIKKKEVALEKSSGKIDSGLSSEK